MADVGRVVGVGWVTGWVDGDGVEVVVLVGLS